MLPSLLAIASGSAFVVWWWSRERTPWRWFWLGGLIWFVGAIVLKGAAAAITLPAIERLKPITSPRTFEIISALHSGSMTGVFEMGTTLAFAVRIRSMSSSSSRMIAVGFGAGALEAWFVGLLGLLMAWVLANVHHPRIDAMRAEQAATIPPRLAILLPAVERVIATLCHAGSRVLVLSSVADARARLFVWAFSLMFAVDAWASFASSEKLSPWWIMLGLCPLAIVSALVLRQRATSTFSESGPSSGRR